MLGRVIIIVFLSLRLIFWYCVLLATPKKGRSILLIPSFTEYGGTRTYFFYLIEFLFKKNYTVIVMLTKNQCDEGVLALQKKYPFTIHEMNFALCKSSFLGTVFYKKNQQDFIYQLKELIYCWRQVRKYKSSSIICSEGNPELLLFLLLTPVRVFYILHTIAVYPLDKLKKKMLNATLSKKKQIITVSNSAKEHLLNNWTNERKAECIKVVYNFYEPTTTNLLSNKLDIKRVLTVGTVAHYKNPFFWIDVCKAVLLKYPNDVIEFLWAGDGELLADSKVLVKDIPQIKFIGYQKNIEQLYLDCTLYFQPSILESHGIAVLGAMFFKKPCVVSNRQGLPESVVNNITGFVVDIEDPLEAANAILTLLNNPDKVIEFGQAGRVRLDTNFTKQKWFNKMNAIFN